MTAFDPGSRFKVKVQRVGLMHNPDGPDEVIQ
jgi:hypothetical protein